MLAPLGYVQVWADSTAVGYGLPGGDDKLGAELRPRSAVPGPGFHQAFVAFVIDPDGYPIEAVINAPEVPLR